MDALFPSAIIVLFALLEIFTDFCRKLGRKETE